MTSMEDDSWRTEIRQMLAPLLTTDSLRVMSDSELAGQFDNDNHYFKKVLRVLLLCKVGQALDQNLHFEESLEKTFPRAHRKLIFAAIKDNADLEVPSLELGDRKFYILASSVVVPLALFGYFVIREPSLIIDYLAAVAGGLLLVIFVPSAILTFIFPSLLSSQEIQGSTTIGDFIDTLVLLNWGQYRAMNFKKALRDIHAIVHPDRVSRFDFH